MSLPYHYKRKWNKVKRARKHGFMHRSSSVWGKNILKSRRSKWRYSLTVWKIYYGKRV